MWRVDHLRAGSTTAEPPIWRDSPEAAKDAACTKCGLTKPVEEFPRDKSKRSGRSTQCKVCKQDYLRARRDTPAPRPTAEERFWAKVEKTGTCWLWIGAINKGGYGTFRIDARTMAAHRLSYMWLVQPLIDGLEIDHLCRVRNCVNPAHLEQVTPRVNTLRSGAPAAHNHRKTHCKRGHEFTPENTRLQAGGRRRVCKACEKLKPTPSREAGPGWFDAAVYVA